MSKINIKALFQKVDDGVNDITSQVSSSEYNKEAEAPREGLSGAETSKTTGNVLSVKLNNGVDIVLSELEVVDGTQERPFSSFDGVFTAIIDQDIIDGISTEEKEAEIPQEVMDANNDN